MMHHSNELKNSGHDGSAAYSLMKDQSLLTEQNSTILQTINVNKAISIDDDSPEEESINDSDMEQLSYD